MNEKLDVRKAVLLVDDDPNILFIGKYALKKIGYLVFAAESSEKALQIFGVNWKSISCVVLDFAMPGMNGVECLGKLREINPEIKVIISTGYEFDDLPKNLEIEGFLKKPYNIDTIRDLVMEIVDK